MRLALAIFLLWPSLAMAQSDPALLDKMIAVLVDQRNAALNREAQTRAELMVEIDKLRAEVARLQWKTDTEPKPKE